MKSDALIYVAGHTGMIGSAIARRLNHEGYNNVILVTHSDLDLSDTTMTDAFFEANRPDYVILAAGRVGGIIENQTFPADFINTNLAIQLNVLRAAQRNGVKKLILFASSCMYPRECPQPMAETALLSGHPEPTSMAYAISKLAGMQMCLAYNTQYPGQQFIPVIPNSSFGPNDNFELKSGHVLSVLIRRFHEAKALGGRTIELWGSGTPRREFVYSDDIADACIFLLREDTTNLDFPINLGTGYDISISELAESIANITGYKGTINWDSSKPDGAPRKLLDSTKIATFGWEAKTDFTTGLQKTYQWFLENKL